MRRRHWFALCLVLGLAGRSEAQTRLLNSFETAGDRMALKMTDAQGEPTSEHATEGATALQVRFLPAEWPNVRMSAEKPWDWRGFDGLAIDVFNPAGDTVSFGIRVDDDLRADGKVHCRQVAPTIGGRQSATFVISLAPDPMTFGMRGLPAAPGLNVLGVHGTSALDLSHIVSFQVFLHRPAAPRTLVLDNMRLLRWMVPLDKIVDEFGQYAKADWPGKLKNAGQLADRRKAEEAELKARPSLPDRDGYGGWVKGPALGATGYFRTEKLKGKWWLVTPEGHLFWSMGMDCVSTHAETFTAGREYMFGWLPAKNEPLARHIGFARGVHSGPVKEGATFNFLTANLERKFGRDYQKAWFDLALARLPSWGFNTIGNWSDVRLYGNGYVPYVATVHIGGEHGRVSSGSDYWGRMHDPYDPRFAEDTAKALRAIAERVKDDPWCVGYFVDNELSWGGFGDEAGRYGLARGALAESRDCPAKRAFIARLRGKYGDIARLNQAWGASLAGWDALEGPFKPQAALTDAMKADMAGFVRSFALQYFTTVRDQLRRFDQHHLYLGCRFAWLTQEAVAAADEVCDVVSFNIYAPKLDARRLPVLASLAKPCIIGEFHFGALDRGMFHTGLVAVSSQAERAAMYREYVGSVLDHPLFVGCHWFQYVDEPLTGRSYDGENYNIGFVTVTDTPYAELVEAARAVHGEAYSRRWGDASTR